MEEKKTKILVVDDEPEIVTTLRHFLSAKGYEVLGALNGDQALDVLEKEKMDLILLDLMMPGIKGTDLAKIVKRKYPSIKIIIVTAYPEDGKKLSQEKLTESIFVKPVRIQDLYNRLLEVLNPSEAQTMETMAGHKTKVRVLLIKAKVLFIEPSAEVYNFLSSHLKSLSYKGENYETAIAQNEGSLKEKMNLLNPDILAVNASFLNLHNKDLFSIITQNNLSSKEIIVYNIEDIKSIDPLELERFSKATEVSCFKNGLIEIKWVEL